MYQETSTNLIKTTQKMINEVIFQSHFILILNAMWIEKGVFGWWWTEMFEEENSEKWDSRKEISYANSRPFGPITKTLRRLHSSEIKLPFIRYQKTSNTPTTANKYRKHFVKPKTHCLTSNIFIHLQFFKIQFLNWYKLFFTFLFFKRKKINNT